MVTTLERLLEEPMPITSLTETGEKLGISKQRVKQLVDKYGIPTDLFHGPGYYACQWCGVRGKPNRRFCRLHFKWSRKIILKCDQCQAYFARGKSVNRGARQDPRNHGRNYCSIPCRMKALPLAAARWRKTHRYINYGGRWEPKEK